MWILGFSGGPDPGHPPADDALETRFVTSPYVFHDAAAVLLEDGKLVAAIEQERLDRIKHSNRFPAAAIRFCLEHAGLRLADIDHFAYYSRERALDWLVGTHMLQHPWLPAVWDGKSLLTELFARHLGAGFDSARLSFIDHHTAHAMSASAMAPFDKGLVVTLDGQGNGLSGTVFVGQGRQLTPLAQLPASNSIGDFYTSVIAFLGYRQFDEYKVMGLAPYGDPQRFRALFQSLYTLHPGGKYTIDRTQLAQLMAAGPPRRHGEPFTQVHKDLAAALQESVERLAFHHIEHYQTTTGLKNLCLAGGLAHNCTLNGKLLRAGLFDQIFVQPASHDAGCALGAALCVHQEVAPDSPRQPLTHLSWGRPLGDNPSIGERLARWDALVTFRQLDDKYRTTARLLAEGAVIGYAHGRSEFGPRALGNRSILADPRPAENKTRINAMVKKREGYRPFAPAVLAEESHHYFEVPEGLGFPYMIFVMQVRQEMRSMLGAITHVDGTARIQTVSRQDGEDFWRLIDAFRELTGVPILLNTSFNNHKEPIIDSLEDALVCFLTTDLNYLVAGDFLVEKKDCPVTTLLELTPSLPSHIQLRKHRQQVPGQGLQDLCSCLDTTAKTPPQKISSAVHAVLAHADGRRPLKDLVALAGLSDRALELSQELHGLWTLRLLTLQPLAA